ncbi:hypothetical protein [Limnospira sp. PMC 289.06]|uniref:hypothetical protein n=1 Tax=Limnospira sp. PMC 289.06 TaxID=2981094 RepID=UPI0028E16BC9|nr:hypothetical protein [Limnospira sp. PMC 289.06]MDT9185754.1 hypothetical protein [Limnospira sp. PMC 289.06]
MRSRSVCVARIAYPLGSAIAQRARQKYRLSPRKCIPVASRNCDRLIQLPRPFQLIRLSQQLTRTHSLTTPHN